MFLSLFPFVKSAALDEEMEYLRFFFKIMFFLGTSKNAFHRVVSFTVLNEDKMRRLRRINGYLAVVLYII